MLTIAKLILKATGSMLGSIFEGVVGDWLDSLRRRDNHELVASFGLRGDLLSRFHEGFTLDGKRGKLSRELSSRSLLVVGPSGSGKSTYISIPNLFNAEDESYIVHDPSGEMLKTTGGALHDKGYTILILNLSNPEAANTGFNPLGRVRHSRSGIRKVISMMVRAASGKSSDPFWDNSAIDLLSILAIRISQVPAHYFTPGNLCSALIQLQANPDTIDLWFAQSPDQQLFDEYKAIIGGGNEKMLASIIATAKAALQIYADPIINASTSFDLIDFEKLRGGEDKVAIFLQGSTADMTYLSGLHSILFDQLFNFLLRHLPQKEDRHIRFIIDETPTLHIPTLATAVTNLRKYDCSVALFVQSTEQLDQVYSHADAATIRANCYTKVFLSGQPLRTCQELEATLGKYQYEDEKGGKRTRTLHSAQEIRQIDHDLGLILAGPHPPLLIRMKPWYQQRRYVRLTKLQGPANMGNAIPLQPPTFPFHSLKA